MSLISSQAWKRGLVLIGLFIMGVSLYQAYPYILFKVGEWQRGFNLELTAALKSLKQNETQAGLTLISVSLLYGIFHAVGPGHGKFILSSYLSLEQTKLPYAMKITLVSALVQGLVAIVLVSIIVVAFTLSRAYFNLTLNWVERGGFMVMILFGLYWCYLACKENFLKPQKALTIRQIQPQQKLQAVGNGQNFAKQPTFHTHTADCGCGHQHLPSSAELAKASDWKSSLMLILGIGLRPCSGAILVLFLSYTLDLYIWGLFSALAMAMGTGLTLMLFAWLVLLARNKAIQAGRWYFSVRTNSLMKKGLRGIIGVTLILFGAVLLHSSFIDVSGNILFRK